MPRPWPALLALAGSLLAQEAAPIVLPINLPDNQLLLVENIERRLLASGETAEFRQQADVRAVRADGAWIVSYRSHSRSCTGPAPICAAFQQLSAGADGRLFRFRVGAGDGRVTLLDAVTVPVAPADGEAAEAVASFVADSEAAAPGAMLAADLQQLMRYAGSGMPAQGEVVAVAEGELRLTELTPEQVRVVIARDPRVAGGVSLHGQIACRISRITGLIDHCVQTDWLGDGRDRPLRQRETRVTSRPVSGP